MKKYAIGTAVLAIITVGVFSAFKVVNRPEQPGTYQKEIQSVLYADGSRGVAIDKYLIDLNKKQFGTFGTRGTNHKIVSRARLNDAAIDQFILDSARYGFTLWEDSYSNAILDGHRWRITITYADGTQRVIEGSNAYPETWNEMGEAFSNLTNESMQLIKIEHGLEDADKTVQTQPKTYQKEIDTIYVYHSEISYRSPEYKIDLPNRQLWAYTDKERRFINRDETLENEGFLYVSDLDKAKMDPFLLDSARFGFTLWDERYDNATVEDGHNWGIAIHYADGSRKHISGSNAYPGTWDEMRKVFEDFTGKDILTARSSGF